MAPVGLTSRGWGGGRFGLQERGPPEAAPGGRRDLPRVGAVGLPHQDDPQGDGPAGGELSGGQGDAGARVLAPLDVFSVCHSFSSPRLRRATTP